MVKNPFKLVIDYFRKKNRSINLVQYDRYVPIIIEVEENSLSSPLEPTDVVHLEFALPGGQALIQTTDIEVESNLIKFKTRPELCRNSGKVQLNVAVIGSNNERKGSFTLPINVDSNSIDEFTVPEPILVTVKEELEVMITEAQDIYTQANLSSYLKKSEANQLYLTQKQIIDLLLPVGSIRTFSANVNPNVLYPGTTWNLFGQGRVEVGIDSSDPTFANVRAMGGSKVHELSKDEMPAHNHPWRGYSAGNLYVGSGSLVTYALFGNDLFSGEGGVQESGSGRAHNNLQPYVVVYRWERTK